MTISSLKKTPLHEAHHELKARIGEFAGWELPLWYSSVLDEHNAVRSAAGMFDVSDMGRVRVTGRKAGDFLNTVLTRPVKELPQGSVRLCLMCLQNGGILDDLLVYRTGTLDYLIVWNAAGAGEKLDWLARWAGPDPDIVIEERTGVTAMLAVQGPAVSRLDILKGVSHLRRYHHAQAETEGMGVLVSRTGYTGEDGFEIICEAASALPLWRLFLSLGVRPCGLAARDILRLEAGMLLYGQDMDRNTNPFEAGLEGLADLGKGDFVGRDALLAVRRDGVKRRLVGFKMVGREIPRSGYPIVKSGRHIGNVASGGYAPSVGTGVGLGYVPVEMATIGDGIEIVVRDRPVPAVIADRRFYRGGAI